ncbi:hypothetical protein Anapl_11887 [Anas platyrhynchos]|uniref:Uncharacterized protein n=1 Tax=Anas platyrhynchos TaxID=8839 RepID=R0LSK2_ANAPL|nr:hypothetical protein Anapl_11887 [Anas platyrhynchos]
MLKVLTEKLRSQTLNEIQPFQLKSLLQQLIQVEGRCGRGRGAINDELPVAVPCVEPAVSRGVLHHLCPALGCVRGCQAQAGLVSSQLPHPQLWLRSVQVLLVGAACAYISDVCVGGLRWVDLGLF